MRLSLRPSTQPTDYPFTHRLRTRFAETDAMGVIHHGAYAPYLEEARAALLEWLGHPYTQVRAEDGVDFSVLELYIHYRHPLRFGDEVDIGVAVDRVTRTTFEVPYLLTVGGEVRSTAVTVHAAVDGEGRATRLPVWMADVAVRAGGG
jgi:acyl-CoA thioester hydrolase